jgi:TPR repeat protein
MMRTAVSSARHSPGPWLLVAAVWAVLAGAALGETLEELQARAKAGDAEALTELAERQQSGVGAAVDLAAAVNGYQQAAAKGNLRATTRLGRMHLAGIAVDKNPVKALHYFRAAAEGGDTDAMSHLGLMHIKGVATRRDPPEAIRWFRKAADAGNPRGMVNLSMTLAGSHSDMPAKTEARRREATEWHGKARAKLQAAADTGDAESILILGTIYVQAGQTNEANRRRCAALYRQAAGLGSTEAMRLLGLLHSVGVDRDPDQGLDWWRKAADRGDPEAMYMLAVTYRDGTLATKDAAAAHQWAEKAANGGHPGGMWLLAYAYQHGEGMPKDDQKSRTDAVARLGPD